MEKSSRIVLVVDRATEALLQSEILIADLPTDLELTIHVIFLEEEVHSPSATSGSIVKKADHLFCDAVFFISQDACGLARCYLHWLRHHENLSAIGQVKPVAYIHCLGSHVSRKELHTVCSTQPGGENILATQLDDPTFRRTIITKDRSIAPWEDILQAMDEGLAIRTSLCLGWSKKQNAALRAAYVRHLENGNTSIFRVRAVAFPVELSVRYGIDPIQALTTTNRHRIKDVEFAKVVADYFGYYYGLQPSSHADKSRRQHSLSDSASQSRSLLLESLTRSPCLTLGSKKWLTTRVIASHKAWADIHLRSRPFDRGLALSTHISNLRNNVDFLRSQEYGPMCVLCFSRPMRTMLECNKHALCARCTNHISRTNEPGCPICNSQVRLQSSKQSGHSRGRILSLDGGGVKGFIQLEILRMIELEIGLDLPLHRFFDLIVGTSIGSTAHLKASSSLTFPGGLIALGIGTKQWSVATCQEKLARLSAKIFSERSTLASLLARMTGGWSAKLTRAMRVFWFDSIYNGKVLESVLREAYGETEQLQGSSVDSVSVAVTATTGASPPCAIFTNYDKSTHPKEQAYGWPGKEVASKVSIWEAARCTSAAPVYFAEKVLFGSSFHDGGMLHNNPTGIACREGSTLWRCPAAENLHISVGCGDLQVNCSGRSSFARLWNAFSHKLSPAKEEEIRALWGADVGRRYERLDPRLDLPEIPLDSLHMMLDALPAARASMSTCSMFSDQVRKVSWMLIASTFYAESIAVKRFGARKIVSLRLASRLGTDVARVWHKWPEAYFRLGDKELHFAGAAEDHYLQMSCITAKHELDVTFNFQGRTSSISGFPLVLSSLTVEASGKQKSVLGKRKR